MVLQRVSEARVEVNGETSGEISRGILLLVGFESEETEEEMQWMARKVANLRIFDDIEGVMNLSVKAVEGQVLAVSQFTLHATTRKGNRPSYNRAAKPDIAEPLYQQFVKILEVELGQPVETGEFGADMQVHLVNDGPVTIIIDTKLKE